jgi:ornithine cyclodeaminase
MAEVEQGPEAVSGTYLLSHNDVRSVIAKSGGSISFIERLAEEIEVMYGDKNLHSIDRQGIADGYDTSEIMAAGGDDYDVIKVIGSHPDARPTVNGNLTLGKVGRPGTALIVNASFLTAVRTATTSAMVLHKTNPEAETMLVIGAGEQGQEHAFAAEVLIPGLKRVMFLDVDEEVSRRASERFDYVTQHVAEKRGVNPTVVESIPAEDSSIEQEADIIVTATYGMEEVLTAERLKPGVVVAAVGADMVGKRELRDDVYKNAKFVTDELKQSLREGELQHASLILGVSQEERDATKYYGSLLGCRIIGITELLEELDIFRARPEPITIYDSTGFAGQDLSVGRLMMKLLEEQSWPKIQFHPPGPVTLASLLGR